MRPRAPACPDPLRFRRVLAKAARITGVSEDQIVGACREPHLVRARDAVIWVAVDLLGMSLSATGRRLARRDHSTIATARRRAERRMEGDAGFRVICGALRLFVENGCG